MEEGCEGGGEEGVEIKEREEEVAWCVFLSGLSPWSNQKTHLFTAMPTALLIALCHAKLP